MLYNDKPLANIGVVYKEISDINDGPFYTADAMKLAFMDMYNSQLNISVLNNAINVLPTAMNRAYTEIYNQSKQIHEKWYRKLIFKRKSKYDGLVKYSDSFMAAALATGALDKYWDSLSEISKLYIIENALYYLGAGDKNVDHKNKEYSLWIEIVNAEGLAISSHETLFQAMYNHKRINGNAINSKIYCSLIVNDYRYKVDVMSALTDAMRHEQYEPKM